MAKRNPYFGDFRATYDVVEVSAERRALWLVDLDGPRSVTNDAERVCEELSHLYPGSRLFYRDTDGNWDELVHDAGRFLRFAPARFAGHARGAPIVDFEEPTRG